MSGLNTSNDNQRFFSYEHIKNQTLRFKTPVRPVRILLRDSYNIKLFLSRVPVIGIFLENCRNITISVESGSKSTVDATRCEHIQLDTDDMVNDINISEYLSSNITINGHRIDGVWVSSEWKL